MTENSLVFIAASDAHFKTGDHNSETGLRHLSQAMRLIAESYPIDFGAYLGDMTSAGTDISIADGKREIMKVRSALFPTLHTMPSFICSGTEDYLLASYNRNGRCISQAELYNLTARDNRDVTVDEEHKKRGFFYKDLNAQKVRVICLNTSDTYGENLNRESETAVMKPSQLQWLCESLDLSDKADASEWGIILLGHHPLTMINKFTVAVSILDAYCKGNAIELAAQTGEIISYDFSGKNKAKILGQFHGHLHNYKVNFITDSKIPVVAIPNASFYNNNFYSADRYTQAENLTYSEDITYNKSVNTVNDTAFCVVVIDKASGRIHALHYGSGVDRYINGTTVNEDSPSSGDTETDDGNDDSDKPGGDDGTGNSGNTDGGNTGNSGSGDGGDSGNTDSGEEGDDNTGGGNTGEGNTDGDTPDSPDDEVSYTNLVPTSITAAKYILDGVGYITGYRLDEAGNTAYGPEYSYTGHIATSYGDIMRIAGGTYDGTPGNYIFAMDESFNIIWLASLTGVDDEASGLSYGSSGVIKFSPSLVQNASLENIAYIRVSTIGLGENLIVTRNERITDLEEDDNESGGIINYVNIIQYAMDAAGNIYGTNGYRNSRKLLLTGIETVAEGYVATGFIVADKDAVIRTKGLEFDGEEGSCLCLYDSSYGLISCISLSGSSDSANGISYDGTVHTFTPKDAQNDFSSIAYFRLSGKGNGENAVVTYCEEIN